MKADPIVEEIRAIRRAMDEAYPDFDSLFQHVREYQQRFGDRLVRRQPQRALKAKPS